MLAIGQRFDEIESELDVLTELHDKPAGTVRITSGDHVLRTTLLPKLGPSLREYPDISVEFDINYGFRNIVADRFDAGVRLRDTIDKDMIAVPIGPKLRMAAAPSRWLLMLCASAGRALAVPRHCHYSLTPTCLSVTQAEVA